MADKTNIQWADTTVNCTSGCDGCELWSGKGATNHVRVCYAGRIHETRLAKSLPQLYAPRFTEVRTIPGRMKKAASLPDLRGTARTDKPWLDGRPRHIFVSDMSDALSAAVPFEFLLAELIEHVASVAGRRHVWLWLTKRPRRMAEFSAWLRERGVAWPRNLVAMTSVTDQSTADKRVPALLGVGDEHTRRGVSYEPAKQLVHFEPWLNSVRGRCTGCSPAERNDPGATHQEGTAEHPAKTIDWLIAGGPSGPEAWVTAADWYRAARDQCIAAKVPFFMKQVGARVTGAWDPNKPRYGDKLEWKLGDRFHGGDWSEWPTDLQRRQMPEESHK